MNKNKTVAEHMKLSLLDLYVCKFIKVIVQNGEVKLSKKNLWVEKAFHKTFQIDFNKEVCKIHFETETQNHVLDVDISEIIKEVSHYQLDFDSSNLNDLDAIVSSKVLCWAVPQAEFLYPWVKTIYELNEENN